MDRADVNDSGLTERERQVLMLLSDGATSAQIGHAFGIAPDTVDQHISSMRRKLRVDNRTELAAFVIRKGLTGIDGNTRFVVWEVIWGGANDSTVEEAVLRYQPQDLVRPYPALKNRLNRNYSELVPDWKDQFGPVLEAIQAARKTGSVVGFATEVDVPEPIGRVPFSGSAEKVADDRFLLRLDVQWPEHLDH